MVVKNYYYCPICNSETTSEYGVDSFYCSTKDHKFLFQSGTEGRCYFNSEHTLCLKILIDIEYNVSYIYLNDLVKHTQTYRSECNRLLSEKEIQSYLRFLKMAWYGGKFKYIIRINYSIL